MDVPKLNTIQLRNLPPGRHRISRRLYLQCTEFKLKNGETAVARSWLYRYTSATGKERQFGLGSLADLSLKAAKEKAASITARMLLDGEYDPIDAKKGARTKKVEQEKDRAERAKNTFGSMAQEWLANESKGWRSVPYRERVELILQKKCELLNPMLVADITDKHILKALLPVWEVTPVTGQTMRQVIEKVFERAMAHDLRPDNPATLARLKHKLPKQAHKVKHHPTLPLDDVPAFYAALKARPELSAKALRLLLLTATRAGDVLGAKPEQFNLSRNIWTIPQTKEIPEFPVVLTQEAVEIVAPLIAAAKPGEPLFPMDASTMRKLMESMVAVKAVPHGLRSSFRTWAQERTHHAREVIEHCMAHIVGNAAERAYARSEMIAKRSTLMREWARFLTTPVQTATVISMKDAAPEIVRA
jgi:integrase